MMDFFDKASVPEKLWVQGADDKLGQFLKQGI
jgi:hypothetical protein